MSIKMALVNGSKVKLSTVKILKTFFEQDGGRPVSMEEFKALPLGDRVELATLAAAELGCEVAPTA